MDAYSFHLADSHGLEPQRVKPLQHISKNNGFKSSWTSQGEKDYTSLRNPLEAITEDFLQGSFSENQGRMLRCYRLPLLAQ